MVEEYMKIGDPKPVLTFVSKKRAWKIFFGKSDYFFSKKGSDFKSFFQFRISS